MLLHFSHGVFAVLSVSRPGAFGTAPELSVTPFSRTESPLDSIILRSAPAVSPLRRITISPGTSSSAKIFFIFPSRTTDTRKSPERTFEETARLYRNSQHILNPQDTKRTAQITANAGYCPTNAVINAEIRRRSTGASNRLAKTIFFTDTFSVCHIELNPNLPRIRDTAFSESPA